MCHVILKMYITVLYFERGTLAVHLNARLSVKGMPFTPFQNMEFCLRSMPVIFGRYYLCVKTLVLSILANCTVLISQ